MLMGISAQGFRKEKLSVLNSEFLIKYESMLTVAWKILNIKGDFFHKLDQPNRMLIIQLQGHNWRARAQAR